jgi:hypothetical protein
MPPFAPLTWVRNASGTVATRSMIGEPTPIRSKEGVVAAEDMVRKTLGPR